MALAKLGKLPYRIASIDCGNSSLKGKLGNKEITFKNKVTTTFSDARNSNTYKVEYKGTTLYVGDYAESEENTEEGKDTDQHIVSTLLSLYLLGVKNNETIDLAYSESATRYKTKGVAKLIHKKLKGTHIFKVGENKEHTIVINEIVVLPEGMGHIYIDRTKHNRQILTIDGGGSTLSLVESRGFNIQRLASSPNGMNHIKSDIREKTAHLRENKIPLSLKKIDEIIELNEYGRYKECVEQSVEKALTHFKKKMGGILEEYDEITLVGGTCVRFFKEFKEMFGKGKDIELYGKTEEDAVWVNVRGNLVFATMILKQKYNVE